MLRREFVFGLGACAALVNGRQSFAQGVATIKEMKPGEFIWRPELSPRGPVVVVVSLPLQLVHVYRNGLAIAVSTCSTGSRVRNSDRLTFLQNREEHIQVPTTSTDAEHAAIDLAGHRAARWSSTRLSRLQGVHSTADGLFAAAVFDYWTWDIGDYCRPNQHPQHRCPAKSRPAERCRRRCKQSQCQSRTVAISCRRKINVRK